MSSLAGHVLQKQHFASAAAGSCAVPHCGSESQTSIIPGGASCAPFDAGKVRKSSNKREAGDRSYEALRHSSTPSLEFHGALPRRFLSENPRN